ncbi:MAG: SpoIIE family protein phosphatase, partial [Candidatus Eiseniibacteriota bacterium]
RLAAALIEGHLTSAHLTRHVARLWKEINFVHEIGETIERPFDLERSCQALLELALDMVDAQRGSLFLVVDDLLRPVASRGVPTEYLVPIALDDAHSIAAWVVRHGEPLVLNDAQRRPPALATHAFALPDAHSDSFLSVPLEAGRAERAALGVLNLAGKRDGHFASDTLKLVVGIARQAAGAIHRARLTSELLDTERIREELRLASEIHTGLLPASVPRLPGYELAAALRPASAVGGDYYDWLLHGDRLYLLIADVAGHGLGAALLVSTVRSALRAGCRAGLGPREVVARLNDVVADLSGETGLFATAQVVELHGELGRVAGAAHPPALKLCPGSGIVQLGCSGPPAGALPDAEFPEAPFRFAPGETIVLYTDGLLEGAGASGLGGLEEALRTAGDLPPGVLVERLVDRVDATGQEADDRTVLVIRRHAGPTA